MTVAGAASEVAFDVVVVGGGSCGSVVAARLSEDPSCAVLLLESGPGFPSAAAVAPELLDAGTLPIGPDSEWLDSYPGELTPSLTRTVARGRVLGGSGAINGSYFIRARPSDFDAWPESWSFDSVLPYFRSMESDSDFGDDFHGRRGPIPVSRVPAGSTTALTQQFLASVSAAGFGFDADKNDPASTGGIGPVPCNVANGVRTSTALAYLFPALVRRNLTVRDRTTVLGVTFDGTRATGVDIAVGNRRVHVRAGRVVLCAGAVRTPALLMLSGVGPADHLTGLGISVVQDHSQVGQSFSDHPEVAVHYRVPACGPMSERSGLPMEAVLHVDDLEIRPYSTPFHQLISGLPVGVPMIGIGLMRSDSRGHIRLRSNDPLAPPSVHYGYLDSALDRAKLADGVDLVEQLLGDDAIRPGTPMEQRLGTSLHLSGSCAMGTGDAVVDELCMVRGIDNLDIVDTSAFPVVPSRGPHATAIMFAERASQLIRERTRRHKVHRSDQDLV